jgi:hypothetical protein
MTKVAQAKTKTKAKTKVLKGTIRHWWAWIVSKVGYIGRHSSYTTALACSSGLRKLRYSSIHPSTYLKRIATATHMILYDRYDSRIGRKVYYYFVHSIELSNQTHSIHVVV